MTRRNAWQRVSWLMASAIAAGTGCTPESTDPVSVDEGMAPLSGDNLAGSNLAGSNLAGSNLAGSNLAGFNMGGSNLAGSNLAGSNLAGVNMGGNNLAGSNLAGSNLAGSNLAGSNLAGSNLAGSNLAGSNLAGSNLAGSNTAGNNLAGSNLAGSNLAGSNTGANIHGLTAAPGMLYSREDVWLPKTGQCIVSGIGSTAFPKLLGQQSVNAKINVALGRLPWGFASTSGGPVALQAWEAVVWGDKTYCVFVLAAPPATSWSGVAGFIKAVFRWNAPPTQGMDISGIEASAPFDPTLDTSVRTYAGMMNAAARLTAGTLNATAFVAGELGFVTATTNNQSVMVDFSSWVRDVSGNAMVLGNVQSVNPPTWAEALYVVLDNGDGTVQVIIDDAASSTRFMPPGMVNSVVDLDVAYLGWQAGIQAKPVPRRCNGALFLNTWFGEPVPPGKCDAGLQWTPAFCSTGSRLWSTVAGTTAPMNGYMQLTQNGGAYRRAMVSGSTCGTMKPVLSETYVHMWERSFDIPPGACTAETNAAFCSRRGKNCGPVTGTDNCGVVRTVPNCGVCISPAVCGGGGVPNVCAATTTKVYEAESTANILGGAASVAICPEGFTKMLAGGQPGQITGACSGGARVRYLGGGSFNALTIPNVSVTTAKSYTLTLWAMSTFSRTFKVSVNGNAPFTRTVLTPTADTPQPFTLTIPLRAGVNSIRIFNETASAPELDRITVGP